ncbi:MAG: M23 family metallopeptidase [Bacteroidales bacterium]
MRKVISSLLLIVFILFSTGSLNGQNIKLQAPLAIPISLSGSFGEIRTDHFHSGIDLRTNGTSGYRVYASDTGFVSRIKVSAIGFGNTIYIEHPNGLTTVYAHLDKFSPKIAQYVENAQYSQKSFEVELFPGKHDLPVKKGDVIALSGNSGSSGGPHLHYEVRHTSSQIPVAPSNFLLEWKNIDNTAPSIKKVFIYQIDSIGYMKDSLNRTALKFKMIGNKYIIPDTIYAFDKVGLGVESYDIINNQSSRCGFKSITLTVNNQQTYKLDLGSFSFAETKYVNSVIDYYNKALHKEEIVKLWVDDNNNFSGLKYNDSRGYIDVANNKTYDISIIIEDFSGNKAIIEGTIAGRTQQKKSTLRSNSNQLILKYDRENKISTDDYEITIPKDALYHDIYFSHTSISENSTQTIYRIHNSNTPIHKKYTFKVMHPSIPQSLLEKAFIGYVNGNSIDYCDSKIIGNSIEATCRKFGDFTVAIDTIPPQIKPLNLFNKSKIENTTQLRFKLTDNTGINTYNGYIDGKWEIFEWDPKTETLRYDLGRKRISQKKWHQLKLEVTDNLNNKSEYLCEFFW